MKILCRHGHFAFYPRDAEDISRFCNYYKTTLLPYKDYYTFPFLIDAPRHSLKAAPYLGLPATVTFEGRDAAEVMRENGFVYSIALGLVVPVSSVTTIIDLPRATNYYLGQTTLIQPGSLVETGGQILSYDAEFLQKTFKLKIRSFSYE